MRVASLRIIASVLSVILIASAQAQEPVPLPRLDGPIQLDGRSDEPAWQAIDPLPMTMYKPVFEGTPTERTEIRVAYDDQYLYVAGRLYDSTPAGMRANTLYRDQYSGGDLLALILDTFNDNENALFFHINPAGVRVDIALSNDAQGDFLEVANFDWNTYWNAKTVRNEEGWFAEMRIPFSSLGFQNDRDRVVMGLIAYRYIARKNEVQVYPAIPPRWNFYTPSQGQDVVLEGVQSRTPIYVTPYLLGGLEQTPTLNSHESAYQLEGDPTQDLGLDVKYNLTSDVTLDLTLNTDFAQVEADNQQVNLTRFSLFFPEKRRFFQERASLFDVRLGFRERLFHSRRIGLSESGEPIPILGGLRVVGRVNGWDVGLLDMQTARHGGLPSENFGVARLRRQVLNPFSYAGGMVTSRIDEDGSYNVAYALDGLVRVVGDEYLTLQWSQTFDSDPLGSDAFDFVNAGFARARWERRQQQGWIYFTDLTWSGSQYHPAMGFVTRQNVTKLVGRLAYGWLPGEQASLRTVTPTLSGLLVTRNRDGTVESGFLRHEWPMEWKSGALLTPGLQVDYEDLQAPLSLPENVQVPAGSYDFYRIDATYTMPISQLLRTHATVGAGTFYDGWTIDLRLDPAWNLSRFLELGGVYQYNRVRFPDRGRAFDAHIGRLRLQTALDTKASVKVFVQYNSAADLVTANVRFRYNFREGNDLWLVYNEGLNSDRPDTMPVRPLTNSRTILLKYTHTFIQ